MCAQPVGEVPGPTTAPSEITAPKKQRVPTSCTKTFDSLYYCYSPFHQAREYYVTGELDDCRARLRRFRMCVMSRFRSQSESEVLYEAEEEADKAKKPAAPPVWTSREEYVRRMQDVEEKEAREMTESQKRDKETENWWL